MNGARQAGVRRAFIHVGTHKTGTTAIQYFLLRHASALREIGVFVPRTGRLAEHAEGCGHHNVALELTSEHRYDPAVGSLSDLIAEVAASRAECVCVSSEEFENLYCRPTMLIRLRDAFAQIGYSVTIVLYLRPQVDYLEAIYAEIAKGGHFLSFETCVRSVIDNDSLAPGGVLFAYDRLVDAFAEVFGSSNVVVRAYRRTAQPARIIRDFATIIGISDAQWRGFDRPSAGPINVRLSYARTLAALYGAGTGQAYVPGVSSLPEEFARPAAEIDGPFDPIRPREVLQIVRHYGLRNLWLSLRHRTFVGCVSRARLAGVLSARIRGDAANVARRQLLDRMVGRIARQSG